MKEPKYTCPKIDGAISELEEVKDLLEGVGEDYSKSDSEEVRDILNQVGDVLNKYFYPPHRYGKGLVFEALEEIREANSELRSYGNYWEKKCEEKNEEIETLEGLISELENEVSSLEVQIDNLVNEVDELTIIMQEQAPL